MELTLRINDVTVPSKNTSLVIFERQANKTHTANTIPVLIIASLLFAKLAL